MALKPIYNSENIRLVHSLRYDWTGWLKDREAVFPETLRDVIEHCRPLWSEDGLELGQWRAKGDQLQCLFDVQPKISPALCVARTKGRLQYALRKFGTPVSFMRKVGFRSLGDNTREIIRNYIAKQVKKSDYVDPRYKDWLDQFKVIKNNVSLAEPDATTYGRYWYNLHLVIVVRDRSCPMTHFETFATVRDWCYRVAKKKDCRVAELSVMPDHVHLALRGNIEISPEDICLAFLNNLSYALGYNRCWSDECYVGTFSEYRIDQIPC